MVKRSLFSFFIFTMMLSLFAGCSVEDGEAQYRTLGFVQENDELGLVIASREGIFLAPELQGKDCVGQCVNAFFKVDYDNQPNKEYITASAIEYTIIEESSYVQRSGTQVSSTFNRAISGVTPYTHLNYGGKVIFQVSQTGDSFDYKLTCNTDSADLSTRKYFMYLQASRPVKTAETNKTTTANTVFDLNDFISRHGKDTVVIDSYNNRHDIRVADFHLLYQSATKNDSIPTFKTYSSNAIRVSRYR